MFEQHIKGIEICLDSNSDNNIHIDHYIENDKIKIYNLIIMDEYTVKRLNLMELD